MTADVFASLQALPQTQTLQPVNQQTTQDGAASQPGLFAALMNECIAEGETADFSAQMFALPEEISEQQIMTFTGNNSFPQSVMNILAGEAEITHDTPSAENMPLSENDMPSQETADDSDKVFWPDDEIAAENPKAPEFPKAPEISEPQETAELPGNTEPAQADVVLTENLEPKLAENIPLQIPAKTAKAPDETEDSSDTEDSHESEETPEIPEGSTELAGLAGVMNPQPQISAHTELQNTQTQPEKPAISSQPTRQRRVQLETQQVTHEQQETSESQEVSTNFREAFVNKNTDPENSGQDSQQEPQNQNQSQNQSQSQNQPQNQSRKSDARNLKTEAVSQKPDTEIRRTDSHSDFGAYFEGVLNSRRTTARTSQPMPLNLRSAENFTQASALRDGLTNVVRFIRADGVQKARVIVDPPALGRVSVELTSGTSGVEASIKVASEQIRQLVQDQISQLRMNLSQQGVQVAEFTVDVQQDNSGNHGQQGQQENTGRFGFIDDSEDDETEDFRIDLEEGLLYWVA